MGLPYPGGVNLDKIATTPDFAKYPLPRPRIEGSEYDFSFSGLKTAVINTLHNASQKGEEVDVPVMCAGVRQRVVDMLLENTMKAADSISSKTLVLAGGVSANSELRTRFEKECEKRGIAFHRPELKYCGDNAAMVGIQAYYEYQSGHTADSSLNAFATLPIDFE